MDRETINKHFELLDEALKSVDLQTEAGKVRRSVSAGEFMLMGPGAGDSIKFKHIDTRNYIVLLPDDRVFIPTGRAFCLGYFDRLRDLGQ